MKARAAGGVLIRMFVCASTLTARCSSLHFCHFHLLFATTCSILNARVLERAHDISKPALQGFPCLQGGGHTPRAGLVVPLQRFTETGTHLIPMTIACSSSSITNPSRSICSSFSSGGRSRQLLITEIEVAKQARPGDVRARRKQEACGMWTGAKHCSTSPSRFSSTSSNPGERARGSFVTSCGILTPRIAPYVTPLMHPPQHTQVDRRTPGLRYSRKHGSRLSWMAACESGRVGIGR